MENTTLTNHFSEDHLSAIAAKEKAQEIAFGPFIFQASMALRDLGILRFVEEQGDRGATILQTADALRLSEYGARVLMEAALGIGLMIWNGEYFRLTKTGTFFLHDDMTTVNADFVKDVCYLGMDQLEGSIRNGKPEGLKVFGTWKTVYEALSQLPQKARTSWLSFDHFYSDNAFNEALQLVFGYAPRKLMDIGGNTGKWALACVSASTEVSVTMVDLPGQLEMAKQHISAAGYSNRVSYYACNLLEPESRLPEGFDAIWMSQFLDCFSEDEIVSILRKCEPALVDGGSVFILETLWDRQRFRNAAFCLQQTSLYFTAVANGNSQMYRSETFFRCIQRAGFRIADIHDDIGLSHSLIRIIK